MIRRATYEDIPAIQKIAVESWRKTYCDSIPPKLQQQFLAFDYNHRQLRHRIDTTAFFVVEHERNVVGFANFSCGDTNELETIYLSPAVWRQGLGHLLMEAGERLYAPGTELCVRVDAHNERAISFYKAHHFTFKQQSTERVGAVVLTTNTMHKIMP